MGLVKGTIERTGTMIKKAFLILVLRAIPIVRW